MYPLRGYERTFQSAFYFYLFTFAFFYPLPFYFCLVYDAIFKTYNGFPLSKTKMSQTVIEQQRARPLTSLSEDEEMFRASVREFAEGELRPRVLEMDERGVLDPALIKQCFDLGLMSIETPEEYGGAGAGFFTAIIAVEELSRVDPSVGVLVDVQNTLVNNAILRWGNDEQKKKYLTQLASEQVGAYALSEAGSGSDAFALATRAVDSGDHFLLNGRKLWITNGNEAGIFIVFANADPEAGYRGITAFIVEKSFEGFAVGKKENKLGIRASSTTEIILEDCRVPKENVLGEIGKGYKVSIETLNEGRIGIGAQMIGLARGALGAALAYTAEREQFGKAVNEFQGVQFQLAEMATELEAARLMVYNAARLKDAHQPFVKEAAMAKLYSSRVAERIASRAIELYGGYGFVKDYPVEKFWRDSKIGAIYEGTSNMQLQTIAKLLTGGSKPYVV
jgi:butyryl-CoA dehydrogenase/short/branched chain acyl-CoA dehydrogenase